MCFLCRLNMLICYVLRLLLLFQMTPCERLLFATIHLSVLFILSQQENHFPQSHFLFSTFLYGMHQTFMQKISTLFISFLPSDNLEKTFNFFTSSLFHVDFLSSTCVGNILQNHVRLFVSSYTRRKNFYHTTFLVSCRRCFCLSVLVFSFHMSHKLPTARRKDLFEQNH